jgi:hypothetical protein
MIDSTSQKSNVQRNIALAVILAESTHIFCCVLPTVVTLFSILASFGVIAQAPIFMLDIHEALHAYEIPVIVFSGIMLVLGWVFYVVSRRIECQKSHCEPHETVCGPQKNSARTVLILASLIFTMNIVVYTTVHIGLEHMMHEQAVEAHHHH